MGDSDKRVLINDYEFRFDLGTPDLVSIARILNHPAVGAESVVVVREMIQADLRWQWPLRIAAFPSDIEALKLAELRMVWPSRALVEVKTLTREEARSELLVIPASVRGGLCRILELPYRVRAGHILLLGPVDVPWRDMCSILYLLRQTVPGGGPMSRFEVATG